MVNQFNLLTITIRRDFHFVLFVSFILIFGFVLKSGIIIFLFVINTSDTNERKSLFKYGNLNVKI